MSPYEALIRAVPLARRSPMLSSLASDRPWFRFGGFILLSVLFVFGATAALAVLVRLVPGLTEHLQMSGPLPDTPSRLLDESVFALLLGTILITVALAVLAAAVVAYRRSPSDFLWPDRRFNGWDLGVGFVAMACVSAILFPVYVWMGAEWSPPITNPLYADWTRPLFLIASVVGLLIAAAAEEIVCRGVLLRLTSQIVRHPVVLCLINGVLFSAIHLDPDPVAFIARALSGAIWTWAAIRLGGIEFALGAHLGNNLMITLFGEPMSAASEVGRKAEWTLLGPELFTAVVVLIVIERLADGPRDWRPAGLASRGSA
ncbi:CPBP family intramembrane glutamic endopeptidase [Brevundimonas sp.]|uniref:CPBP family intramembrane glutamic endopeptidase n=1 Tax=Brevundimonas sp. TaxID=1871086 RepID=UPI003D101A06